MSRCDTGGQLSRVVKASDLGAEGPRFQPWQQHLVEAQVVKAEDTISVGHCVIPLDKGLVLHCSVVWMGL